MLMALNLTSNPPRRAPRVRALLLLILTASCTFGSADTRPTSVTTFSTVGDTVVASTTGDVPESLVRRLVIDWSIKTDTASEIIGDVHSIAVDTTGQVWVWDNATPGLWLVDGNGQSMRRVARVGRGPGEYRKANDIAVMRDGALVMWDSENSLLNFYNRDGSHRTAVPVTFFDCCGLPVIVDTLNRIWLTTHPKSFGGKEKAIDPAILIKNETGYVRYDASGTVIDTVMAPVLPNADPQLTAMHISATGIGGATRNVPFGTYARYAISPLGHIVSALLRPYAVHTEANGKHLRVTREFAPPPVTDEERAQARANIEFTMRRVKRDFQWNGPEIPREKPPINDLAVGLDGRIWIQLSVPSVAYEPESPSDGNKDRPPPVNFRPTEKRWDVFEPDGRYLGRIAAPRAVSVFVMRGNLAWGVVRDENDVPAIVRMHVEPGFP